MHRLRCTDYDAQLTMHLDSETGHVDWQAGSDMSDLDSETGHVDAELPVTINNSSQFLISSIEQLLQGCAGYLNNWYTGCAGYLSKAAGSQGQGCRALVKLFRTQLLCDTTASAPPRHVSALLNLP